MKLIKCTKTIESSHLYISFVLKQYKILLNNNKKVPCKAQCCSGGPCWRWPSCLRGSGQSREAHQSSFPWAAAGLPGFRSLWSGKQASDSSTHCTPKPGWPGCLWFLAAAQHLHHSLRPYQSTLPLQQTGLNRKKRVLWFFFSLLCRLRKGFVSTTCEKRSEVRKSKLNAHLYGTKWLQTQNATLEKIFQL